MDILYKNYITFNILGENINVFSNITAYGISSVIEIGSTMYYLGLEPPILENILFAWQDLNNKILTSEEFDEIIKNNPDAKSVTQGE